MLVKALSQESSAWSYKFTQTLELIQCLLVSDPRGLCGDGRPGRQVGASPMLAPTRPPVHPGEGAQLPSQPLLAEDHTGHHGAEPLTAPAQTQVKSRILQTYPQSLYNLPPMEMLKSSLPPLELAPDVVGLYQKSMQVLDLLLQAFVSENESTDEICFLLQHAEPWLKSSKSYKRKRVVQSVFLLLKYVADYVKLTEEAMPSGLGRQVGLLLLLWQDRDQLTRSHSHQCVYLFLQLLIQQKGEPWGGGRPLWWYGGGCHLPGCRWQAS
ncbi:maestro heat-like repeat family member 5 [Odocoileus virginianus]|uniref:Maestro heat-like repeat family member 5 n=1 Tax=Odocoileus virginianus TaxID=9874 RepID=A0A6J0Y263_ODOVR